MYLSSMNCAIYEADPGDPLQFSPTVFHSGCREVFNGVTALGNLVEASVIVCRSCRLPVVGPGRCRGGIPFEKRKILFE
jgi:hypothetical protein